MSRASKSSSPMTAPSLADIELSRHPNQLAEVFDSSHGLDRLLGLEHTHQPGVVEHGLNHAFNPEFHGPTP